MLKRLFSALALAFIAVAIPAAQEKPADPQKPVEHGRAFIKHPLRVASIEEYASELEKCDTKDSNITISCAEIVRSFNENPVFKKIGHMKDIKELVSYLRKSTSVYPCANRMTRIARVVGDKVRYDFERELKVGEPCVVDMNVNIHVSSLVCLQWILQDFGIVFTLGDAGLPGSGSGSLSGAAKRAAKKTTLKPAKKSSEDGEPGFFSWKRNTGKGFWLTTAGLAVAGTVYALQPHEQPTQTQSQSITIKIGG